MKRSPGEGTIRQLPSGNWCARVTIDGRRKTHTATTQRKAREWLTNVRHEIDTENYIDPSDMTFGDWWDAWVSTYKKSSARKATLLTYAFSRARLPAELLKTSLSKLTRASIQGAINGIAETGGSRRTAELTAQHIKMCLKCAVSDRLIKNNPSEKIELPEADEDEGEMHLLTDPEYDGLVEHCTAANNRDQQYRDCLLTILYTGLRRSEAVNLMWSDWGGDMLQVNGTKTKNAKRRIPIDTDVIAIFERRRKTAKTFYIFETRTLKTIMPRNLYRYIHRLNGHGVHDLRHTYATRAVLAGVDVKTLSQLLGHADVATTMRLYVHPTDDSKRDAACKIAAARSRQGNAGQKIISL